MFYPKIAIHLVTDVPLCDYVEHPQLVRLEGGGAALCLTRHYDERDDSLTWRIPFALVVFISLFRPLVVYTTRHPETVKSRSDGSFPGVTYYRGDDGESLLRAEGEDGEVHFAAKPGQTLWDVRVATSGTSHNEGHRWAPWPNVWGLVPVFTGQAWELRQGHFTQDGKIMSHYRGPFDGMEGKDFQWMRDLYEKGKALLEKDPRFIAGSFCYNEPAEAF